jgi:hypothetical protein
MSEPLGRHHASDHCYFAGRLAVSRRDARIAEMGLDSQRT